MSRSLTAAVAVMYIQNNYKKIRSFVCQWASSYHRARSYSSFLFPDTLTFACLSNFITFLFHFLIFSFIYIYIYIYINSFLFFSFLFFFLKLHGNFAPLFSRIVIMTCMVGFIHDTFACIPRGCPTTR